MFRRKHSFICHLELKVLANSQRWRENILRMLHTGPRELTAHLCKVNDSPSRAIEQSTSYRSVNGPCRPHKQLICITCSSKWKGCSKSGGIPPNQVLILTSMADIKQRRKLIQEALVCAGRSVTFYHSCLFVRSFSRCFHIQVILIHHRGPGFPKSSPDWLCLLLSPTYLVFSCPTPLRMTGLGLRCHLLYLFENYMGQRSLRYQLWCHFIHPRFGLLNTSWQRN